MKIGVLFVLVLGLGCMKDECSNKTALLDPGWQAKWRDQNNGIADSFWCECHTAQPLAPSFMHYPFGGPQPIRNLEDGFPWGLGAWVSISPSDLRLLTRSDTPATLAQEDFEWRAVAMAHCSTGTTCYTLLHMTPTACAPEANAPGPNTVDQPLPGADGIGGSGSP